MGGNWVHLVLGQLQDHFLARGRGQQFLADAGNGRNQQLKLGDIYEFDRIAQFQLAAQRLNHNCLSDLPVFFCL